METHDKKSSFGDMFLRVIAVLGLIAVLLLGAWGIIQLAFAIPSAFGSIGSSISSLFSHPSTAVTSTKEGVVVSAPTTLASGQTLELSWMHSNADAAGQYSYAVSYACQTGLSVKAPLPTGDYQTVACNTPFNYVNAGQHMSVVPLLSGSANAQLILTVTATKLSTGSVTASGSVTTTITTKNSSAITTPTKTTTKPLTTYYPAKSRAALFGYGDLAVTITSVGPTVSNTRISFTIANVGTNVIPAGWAFNATLPINGAYRFVSQPQQALYPGDSIVYTLHFSPGSQNSSYGYYPSYQNYYGYQTGTVTITADPSNVIPEYNKNNNTAQTTVPLY